MLITWTDLGRVLLESVVLAGFLRLVAVPALIERLKAALTRELESFRQELGLARVTFHRHLDLLLGYHNRLHQHYRLCQRAANYDRTVHPERGEVNTKQQYLERLDAFKSEWDADEGKIRLLLPQAILECHLTLLDKLNTFTDAVMDYSEEDDTSKAAVEAAFHPVHDALMTLEAGLRKYLRTEKLLA